jgi:cob(I)alamin adenosyltransferase
MQAKKQYALFKSRGGNKIDKNAIVQGQSKYAAVYGRIASKFQNNVRLLESEINEFFEGLKNISIDEQIEQIESQLDRILADMADASAEMKSRLEKEILPLIREKIEELRRRLEQSGKEEKLEYVDQKIETISAKL